MIWIPSPTEAWEAVQVVSNDAKGVVVRRLNGGSEFKVAGALSSFSSVSIAAMEENCDNLVDLETYSEGIILHHIKKRFSQNKIYTLVGNILIALNPYKHIDIYSLATIERIYNLVKQREATPPHIFSIAANAVFNMREENKNQSILISGESGAGKTEATKKILQFISTVCSSTASRIGPSIEHQILDSNPILESFGNAKTIRNNNSSRFGKYMEVNFDRKHCIKGCRITAYLLEKSRVVKPGPNERNYHVFYMLLAAATKEMRKELALKPADQFRYLNQGGCVEIPRRDDHAEFTDMTAALDNLAIAPAVQQSLFQCLAAILHLGNLDIVENPDVEDGSRISVPSDCRRAAALLGLPPDSLERTLCNRDSVINGEALVVPLTPPKAADQRDSLAKHVYAQLFDFLLVQINASLARSGTASSIGVLDIFGFEVFAVNSFEQLCINYANERLQTFFNEVVFHAEMEVYRSEGLPVDDIEYQDNLGCVRLIDLRGAGIFARLDEECAVPKGSDERLVSKLNQVFDETAATRSPFYQRQVKSALAFSVRHFAGDVAYDARDFLEKNRDALADGLVALLQTSSLALLHNPSPSSSSSAVAAAGPATGGGGGGGAKKAASGGGSGGKLTLAAKFKQDLDGLMAALRGTSPHFVRCVKPNADQAGDVFVPPLALHQLRYSGLFEAIRIRKAGYEVRLPLDAFLRRYRLCRPPGSVPRPPPRGQTQTQTQTPQAEALALLDALFAQLAQLGRLTPHAKDNKPVSGNNKPVSQETGLLSGSETGSSSSAGLRLYCAGRTRVFLRSTQHKLLLDDLRAASVGWVAVHLQRAARGFLTRCRLRHAGQARMRDRQLESQTRQAEQQAMLSEDGRSRQAELLWRADAPLQRRLHEAKLKRVSEERARLAEKRFRSAVLLQKRVRGYLSRKRSHVFLTERLLENALLSREEAVLRAALRRVSAGQAAAASPLARHYRGGVQALLLQVQGEGYVAGQLGEALAVRSLALLRSAVSLSEAAGMPYVAGLSEARETVRALERDRRVVHLLAEELSQCTDMAALLARHDRLACLADAAASRLHLAHHSAVIEARTRCHKVRRLVDLRDRMRAALEVVSPTRMRRVQGERSRLLRVYGPDFLSEENTAIEDMQNMLRLKQTLLSSDVSLSLAQGEAAGAAAGEAGPPLRLNMHDLHALLTSSPSVFSDSPLPSTTTEEVGEEETEEDLLYLPRYVREPLSRIRYASSSSEASQALQEVARLVPQEGRRRFFLRLFKWTVAFASWDRPHASLPALRRHLALLLGDTDPEPGQSRARSNSASPTRTLLSQAFGETKTATPPPPPPPAFSLSQGLGERGRTRPPAPAPAPGPGPKKEGSRKRPPALVPPPPVSWVRDAPLSPASFAASLRKTAASPSRSPARRDRPGTGTAPSSSPRKMTHRTLPGHGPGPPRSPSSPKGRERVVPEPVQVPVPEASSPLPFSQRQSRSEVAARELLKRGAELHCRRSSRRTDNLLDQALTEIRRFRRQLPAKSTFSG